VKTPSQLTPSEIAWARASRPTRRLKEIAYELNVTMATASAICKDVRGPGRDCRACDHYAVTWQGKEAYCALPLFKVVPCVNFDQYKNTPRVVLCQVKK
jgi:predicted transcriptional regulator